MVLFLRRALDCFLKIKWGRLGRQRNRFIRLTGSSLPLSPFRLPVVQSRPGPALRKTGKVKEIYFIARPPELRAGSSHSHELDRTEPVGRWTVNMATKRTAAIGKLTRVTKAPRVIANPPNTSINMVDYAMKYSPGTKLGS